MFVYYHNILKWLIPPLGKKKKTDNRSLHELDYHSYSQVFVQKDTEISMQLDLLNEQQKRCNLSES